MAVSSYGTGAGFVSNEQALATIFEEQVADQIPRSANLVNILGVDTGPGKNVTWSPKFGQDIGHARAEGADVPDADFQTDTKVTASLEYRDVDAPFKITGRNIQLSAAAGNPLEAARRFEEELGEAGQRLLKRVNRDCYNGGDGVGTTAANQFPGLVPSSSVGGILDTGVYAGVDRATYPQWAGAVRSNGGVARALTLDLMRDIRTQIYKASEMRPDVIVCSPEVWDAFGRLLDNAQRTSRDITLLNGRLLREGGWDMLFFDGIPVVRDADVPTVGGLHQMLFLNTSYVKLKAVPTSLMNAMFNQAEVAPVATYEEQFGFGRPTIPVRVIPLAVNGDSYPFQPIGLLTLQVRRPNSCGVIRDIDPSL